MLYKDFLEKSLSNASEIARKNFGKVTGVTKLDDNNQVLTEADLAIGKQLIQEIQETYPSYNIIDEEAGVIDNHSEYTWVVDPIDGTSNFAQGLVTYGIYLGLLFQDKPIAGALALPSLNELYIAERGHGTFLNGKRIHVTPQTELKDVLVAYGIDSHPDEADFIEKEGKLLMTIVQNIRNMRSSNSAFDGAMVAKGAYGGWLCRTSKIWDNVALHILIEEAGGVYTDFFGNPIDYSNPLKKLQTNFSYCTAPYKIHQALQGILHSIK